MPSNSDGGFRIDRRSFVTAAGAARVAGLTGCLGGEAGSNGGGGGGNNSGKTTIQYWTLFGGGDGKAMEKMVTKFNNSHDNITIKRQRLPWDQYYDKLYTALTGGFIVLFPALAFSLHLFLFGRGREDADDDTGEIDRISYSNRFLTDMRT